MVYSQDRRGSFKNLKNSELSRWVRSLILTQQVNIERVKNIYQAELPTFVVEGATIRFRIPIMKSEYIFEMHISQFLKLLQFSR